MLRCRQQLNVFADQANGQLPVGTVAQAQQILVNLHRLLEDERTLKASAGEAVDVYDNFRVKTVSALLEFIAAYGLLPWLPPEVAEIKKMKYLSQRSSSVLRKGSNYPSQDIHQSEVAMPLLEIATETGKGVEPMVRDSILPIIACAGAVLLNLDTEPSLRGEWYFKTFHDVAKK